MIVLKKGQTGHGFLVEHISDLVAPADSPLLNESFFNTKFEGGRVFIDAVLQKGDTLNRNERIYPMSILKREEARYNNLIEQGLSTGEADHPDTTIISLHNFSHRITKIWWVENVLYGTLEIITSPAYMKSGLVCMIGDKIVEYLRRGIKLGISSRGVGSVTKESGKYIVQDDFELVCWDLVHTPSTPGAYLYNERTKEEKNESGIITTKTPIVESWEASLDKFLT